MSDRIEGTVAFRIRQYGQTVAKVEGPAQSAEREIWHYAMQYRADGDVTIQHNAEGHWKRFALLSYWPPLTARKGGQS